MSVGVRTEAIALALIERGGRFLVAKRAPGQRLAGTWEFPGGRIESGETIPAAAEREGGEELGCRVRALRELFVHEHTYPDLVVRLHCVLCAVDDGAEPRALSGSELKWASLDELRSLPIPEANRQLIARLETELRKST